MADIKAKEILKRSKERSKVFDELINSPTHNKENTETAVSAKQEDADSSLEYGIHKFKKTGSGKVRNLCSRFENIIANEIIDSRPASPSNRSIVSTASGSAHRPTTTAAKADLSLVGESRPPMLLSASADCSIGSMSQRPTVPPKSSRTMAPALPPSLETDCADSGSFVGTPTTTYRDLLIGGDRSLLVPDANENDLSTLVDRSIASAKRTPFVPAKTNRAPVPPLPALAVDADEKDEDQTLLGTDSADGGSSVKTVQPVQSDVISPTGHASNNESEKERKTKEDEEAADKNESTTFVDSRPITPEDFFIAKPADRCRPITPNSEVLGSLLDDIYHDMEKFQKMGGMSGGGMVRNEPDAGELQHKISFYRRRQTQSRCSSHYDIDSLSRRPSSFLDSGIAVQSLNSSNASSEPAPTNEATLKRLQEALIVQQDHIYQTSRALAYCRQQDHFRGSAEEIDAQRALLVAIEKRRAYLAERDRIIAAQQSATGVDADASEPRGTLAFSYIAVRLSRDFINMYIQQHSESCTHYFIVLIKHGEQVFHTSMVSSTPTSMKSGYIEFPQYISVAGLTSDFAVVLEVYDMPSPVARLTEKKRKTARKIVAASLGGSSGSAGPGSSLLSRGSVANTKQAPVLETAFRKVGHMTLNRSHLHAAKRFLLTEVLYPLDGVVMLNLQCLSEHTAIVHHGFLSLYQLVSGLGSWTRFWCVLGDGVMSFWRYPEDEERHRDPVVTLELRKCLTDVSEVTNSTASFPHSMQVDVASTPSNGAPTEEIRMLFAADTNEEMMSWTEAINKAIQYAKIWT